MSAPRARLRRCQRRSRQSMRIVVMGSVGLGGYFGGVLARSGAPVTFIARWANLHALQERGLTVHSVNGDFALPVRACADPAGLPSADFVLFCVKTYDAAAAAALLQPVVTASTILLTFQNGVDMAAELQAAFGRGTVLARLTPLRSTLTAPRLLPPPPPAPGTESA